MHVLVHISRYTIKQKQKGTSVPLSVPKRNVLSVSNLKTIRSLTICVSRSTSQTEKIFAEYLRCIATIPTFQITRLVGNSELACVI
ncbi:hypothetical protein TNCV_1560271 [Trichonephila clavipes]|nr:hypothetical protein TNCV_1560271 [Trichonephila clavipes]